MAVAACATVGLHASSAHAGRPDDLRNDGDVIVGCSSLSWLATHQQDLPMKAISQSLAQLSIAGRFGADDAEPLWTVLGARGDRLLPLELRLAMPEGTRVPPGISMFIGSPRITQDETRVHVQWAPESERSTAVRALADQVIQDVGCTVAARMDKPAELVAAHFGPEPDRLRAVLSGWKDDPQAPPVVRFVPLLIERSAEAPWRSLARSPELPHVALRLNVEARPSELLGLLQPPPPAAVLSEVDRVLLHPGTEVGVWTDDKGGIVEMAAVVPVRRPRTVAWWPGSLARKLRRQGQSVERRGRVVGVPLDEEGKRRLWISARRGRLLLGTNPDRVESMRSLDGPEWFPREQAVGPAESAHVPGLVIRTNAPAAHTAGVIFGKDGQLHVDVTMAPEATIPGLVAPGEGEDATE